MKQLIFAMILVAFALGCQDSNSVEPTLDNTNQFKVSEEALWKPPIKNGKTQEMLVKCNYNFNPSAHCGGMLYGCCLDYRYDDAITNGKTFRYLNEVQFWAPSTMEIGKQTIQTCSIYSLNKTERVLESGKIIDGEAWGTFQVKAATGDCLFDLYESTDILFEGKFSGVVNGNVTNVKLVAKGYNSLAGRIFIANEVQVCNSGNGKLSCFSSEIIGKVTPVLKVEE